MLSIILIMRLGSVLIMAFSLLGCNFVRGERCDQMHFSSIQIDTVNSVRLHKTYSAETSENEISRVSGASEIVGVFKYLKTTAQDWRASPFGVPVAGYRVVFFGEEQRLGSVSFGKDFFVGQGCGYFFASSVTEQDILDFAALLGVDKPLDFYTN